MKKKKKMVVILFLQAVLVLSLIGLGSSVQGICPNPTFTKKVTYTDIIECDPNNPEVIDQNSQVGVAVINGRPDYNWEISQMFGQGFHLDSSETNTNTLYSDSTSCGSVTIKVKEDFGYSTECVVRSESSEMVSTECPGQVLEEDPQSDFHSAGCSSGRCETWAENIGCDLSTVQCTEGGIAHYDQCYCMRYKCFNYECP